MKRERLCQGGFLFLLLIAVVGCGNAEGGSPPASTMPVLEPPAGEWVLRAWDEGEPAPDQPEVTLNFVDGGVSGVAGCNSYGASVESEDGGFEIGPMRLTRKACPPPMMEVERRFTGALESAYGHSIEGSDVLRIAYREDGQEKVLTFELRAAVVEREEQRPREAPAPGTPDPMALLVRDIKLDLAERLSVDISEIELVSADPVDWPDASLGCPEPGMNYAQMLTSGHRVELRAGGESYGYHTRGLEEFKLCE